MNRYFLFFLLFFSFALNEVSLAQEQSKANFTLKEAIRQAQSSSVSALTASTRKETRYWDWKSFRANYKPRLSLSATLPEYNSYYRRQPQNDGSVSFVSIEELSGSASLNLEQPIWFTGGTINLSSGLNGYRKLSDNVNNFSSVPVSISLNQPLFGFNSYKWDRRIQPLVFDESKKQFVEEQELIAMNATRRFFSLLSIQRRLEINRVNVQNTDSLYKIAKGRYNLGKIAENELLQLELSLLNSKQNYEELLLELQASQYELKTYIGLRELEISSLKVPDEIPKFSVSEELALSQAMKNRSEQVAFRRRMLEAESRLERVKKGNNLQINFRGQLGFNDAGREIRDVYREAKSQRRASIGLEIPILDWGRAKSKMKSAEASWRLQEYSIQQEKDFFEQEIRVGVRRFEMLRKQIRIAKKSMVIGEKRYFVAKNRYLIGKITISDLNIALQEKDQKIVGYINSLNAFWVAYYNLRKLTLFDFEYDRRIGDNI